LLRGWNPAGEDVPALRALANSFECRLSGRRQQRGIRVLAGRRTETARKAGHTRRLGLGSRSAFGHGKGLLGAAARHPSRVPYDIISRRHHVRRPVCGVHPPADVSGIRKGKKWRPPVPMPPPKSPDDAKKRERERGASKGACDKHTY
jgi:hypothetical protein